MTDLDLAAVNEELKDRSAVEIVQWAAGLGMRCMASTSFSPNSAALLNVVAEAEVDVPVVWVDSGYNMSDAYRVADTLIDRLPLDFRVYTPKVSAARREAVFGGIPHPEDDAERFQQFVDEVKLEPFARAVDELQAQVWITGIRRHETEFRKGLDIVSRDNRGLLRVAPLFYWQESDVDAYMAERELPSCKHYFDPTKLDEKSECGLHTAA